MVQRAEQALVGRRTFLLAGGGTLAALGLAACSSSSKSTGSSSGGAGQYTGQLVASNYTALPDSAPLLIAQHNGYYTKNKLKLGVLQVQASADAVRVIGTQAMFGFGSAFGAVAAIGAGLSDLVIVGNCMSILGLNFIVKADSRYKSAADLKGKKIGVQGDTSLANWLADQFLKGGGLTRADVTYVNTGSVANTLTAVQNGLVDCGFSSPPLSQIQVNKGTIRVIGEGKDIAPTMTSTSLLSSRKFADKNPDVVKRFLTAAQQGMDFLRSDVAAGSVIWAKAAGVGASVAKQTLTSLQQGFGSTEMKDEWVQTNIDACSSLGLLKKKLTVDQVLWKAS